MIRSPRLNDQLALPPRSLVQRLAVDVAKALELRICRRQLRLQLLQAVPPVLLKRVIR